MFLKQTNEIPILKFAVFESTNTEMSILNIAL